MQYDMVGVGQAVRQRVPMNAHTHGVGGRIEYRQDTCLADRGA